jgi:hypothetical protein
MVLDERDQGRLVALLEMVIKEGGAPAGSAQS